MMHRFNDLPANRLPRPPGMPRGFEPSPFRRVFLRNVFVNHNSMDVLRDMRMAFAYSPLKLNEQHLDHLVLVYEDSIRFKNQTGNLPRFATGGFPEEYHEEMEEICRPYAPNVENEPPIVDRAIVNEEYPHYVAEVAEERRTVPFVLFNIAVNEPATLLDMRWCLIWYPQQLHDLPMSAIVDVYKYCSSFHQETNRRLFPGLDMAQIAMRWGDHHTNEMIGYTADLEFQLGIADADGELLPRLNLVFHHRLAVLSNLEHTLFANEGVEHFLRRLDPVVRLEIRTKSPYTLLPLVEHGPHVMLDIYRKRARLATKEHVDDWNKELHNYVLNAATVRGRIPIVPLIPPILDFECAKLSSVDLVKNLAWTDFEMLLALRMTMREFAPPLTGQNVELLLASLTECRKKDHATLMAELNAYYNSDDWNNQTRQFEFQLYTMYREEVSLLVKKHVLNKVCKTAALILTAHEDVHHFLDYIAGERYEVLLRMRLDMAADRRPLNAFPKEELWTAWYERRVVDSSTSEGLTMETMPQLEGWLPMFAFEVYHYGSNVLDAVMDRTLLQKVLRFGGVRCFLSVLKKSDLYNMVAMARHVAHKRLELLNSVAIWSLYSTVVAERFYLHFTEAPDTKLENWTHVDSLVKSDARECLLTFQYLPDIAKRLPRVLPYVVSLMNAQDGKLVGRYIRRVGVKPFLHTINFSVLRRLRKVALRIGYVNRLDEMTDEMFLDTYAQIYFEKVNVYARSDLVFAHEYTVELKEYYYSGVCSDKWKCENMIDLPFKDVATSLSDLRPTVKAYAHTNNIGLEDLRWKIWNEQAELFPMTLQNYPDMPDDLWLQCKEWLTEERDHPYVLPRPNAHLVQEDWIARCLVEELYTNTPETVEARRILHSKTVWIHKAPRIGLEYLKFMLKHSTLSVYLICENFLKLHHEMPLGVESPEVLNAIEHMSIRRLALIYTLVSLRGQGNNPLRAQRNPINYGGDYELHIANEMLFCRWCFSRGSHHSINCVVRYTRQTRLMCAHEFGICMRCGSYGIRQKNRCDLCIDQRFDCQSCHGDHKSVMCIETDRYSNGLNSLLLEVRTIVKATIGLDEDLLANMYREVCEYMHHNQDTPNSIRWADLDSNNFHDDWMKFTKPQDRLGSNQRHM